MRALITILIFISSLATVFAESTYYYSDSKRIPLYKNTSKAIVKSTKNGSSALKGISSMNTLRTISCSKYDISVVEINDEVSIESLRKMMPSSSSSEMTVYPCYSNEYGEDVIPTSYIYVELKSESDYDTLCAVAESFGCEILKRNKFMPLWYTLGLTSNAMDDSVGIANKIMETNMFVNACPAFTVDLAISYDSSVLSQWGLYNSEYEGIDVSASEAWNYSTGSGVVVAVIDVGVDLNHEDLSNNINKKSYDAATGSSPSVLYDNGEISHGTHCAGIIGAERNNNIGISGVAPDVSIMSVSADFNSADIDEQLADGINWARRSGASIMSCSWFGSTESPIIKEAIDSAIENGRLGQGCVMVFCAGNSFIGSPVKFPANYREEVFAVGNVENNGVWNFTSCNGESLLVCAPGTDILSTTVNNNYGRMTGTSMACPHVAGVVALMLELNPYMSIPEIREIIATSVKKVGHVAYSINKKYGSWNKLHGYGLVDASQAVKKTPVENLSLLNHTETE